MKKFVIVIFCFSLSLSLFSQHLILRNKEGKQVNNDTVEVVFYPTQNHGWTEISSEIYIENTTDDTLKVGFKKVQYNPIKEQEYHSFCFAGSCFDSSTYVAPYPTIIFPEAIDSSFSGHYRFDDLLHEPGTYLVSYHFYNWDDSTDTAMVYVIYNTLHQLEIKKNTTENILLNAFPNPAVDKISINYKLPQNENEYFLIVINVSGQTICKERLSQEIETITINTDTWVSGCYLCCLVKDNILLIEKKFMVVK